MRKVRGSHEQVTVMKSAVQKPPLNHCKFTEIRIQVDFMGKSSSNSYDPWRIHTKQDR